MKKPRNNGEWSESRYWGEVRSALRNKFRYWNPLTQCLKDNRRPYKGTNKRQKWEYQCNHCKKWFIRKDVQIDHCVPVGSLKREEDIAGFLRRLTPEDVKAFQILCKDVCHKKKTAQERLKR